MIQLKVEPDKVSDISKIHWSCPGCNYTESIFFNPAYPDAWYKDQCPYCKKPWYNLKALLVYANTRLAWHRNTVITKLSSEMPFKATGPFAL